MSMVCYVMQANGSEEHVLEFLVHVAFTAPKVFKSVAHFLKVGTILCVCLSFAAQPCQLCTPFMSAPASGYPD